MRLSKRSILTFLLVMATLPLMAQNAREFNMDETFGIRSDGTIRLDSDDADVTIRGTDREDVHVVVHYRRTVRGVHIGDDRRFEVIAEEQNGDLVIREHMTGDSNFQISLGSVSETYRITIEAPRSVSLQLDGDDDDYEINGIDGSIDIDADDTDIWLQDCGGSSFRFSMDDGQLEMDGGRGELTLDIDDADIDIRGAAFSRIRSDSDDGDIRLETSLLDSGSYVLDSDDGDLELFVIEGGGEFVIDHDDPSVRVSSGFERLDEQEHRSRYRLPGGSARVDIRTDDGSVRLGVR